MAITLRKTTRGTLALQNLIEKGGPGLHTVHVVQFHNLGGTVAAAQVLYGGDGMLIVGEPTREALARVSSLIDAAMVLGIGKVTVFTETPDGRDVLRFHVSDDEMISESEYDWRRYGAYPDIFATCRAEREERDRVDLLNYASYRRAALAGDYC